MESLVGDVQLHIVHRQQFFILLDQTVAGLLQHAHQCILVQVVQHGDDRQTADKLGDEAELDKVVGFDLPQQSLFSLAGVILQRTAKAQCGLVGAAEDILIQTVERTAADEEDVGGVDLDELLLGVLAAALRGNIADGAFQDLQQSLLHTFTAHVAGDGGIFTLAGDLVDLINIDDTDLSFLDVEVCGLNELEQDVLDVLAHIAGLRQGGSVCDGEGNAQHLGQRLGQQGLANTRGSQQQDVGLLQLNVCALAAQDALIVVVDRDGQHTLGLVLTDDILVQTFLDLCGGLDVDGEIICGLDTRPAGAAAAGAGAVAARMIRLVREQVGAEADAFAADVHAGADDHPLHFVLMFAAEAADQILFVFISAGIVISHNRFSLS